MHSSIVSPRKPHLSLVANDLAKVRDLVAAVPSTQELARLSLQSVQQTTKTVRPEILRSLFLGLEPGEHLRFTHLVTVKQVGSYTTCKYHFDVTGHGSPLGAANMAQRLNEGLQMSCDPMYFAERKVHRRDPLTLPAEISGYERQWHLTPAPMLLRTAATTHALSNHYGSNEYGSSHSAPECHRLPYPARYSDTSLFELTSPGNMPQTSLRVTVRVFPYSLPPQEAERAAHWLRRLSAGNLVPYRSDSPYRDLSADRTRAEPLAALARDWFLSAQGFAFDVIVQSAGPLSEFALVRLRNNLFGEHPSEMRVMDGQLIAALPTPDWACAVHEGQGLPSLFPHLPALNALGIATHFAPPTVMPPVERGVIVGVTSAGRLSTPVILPDAARSQHVAVFGATGSGKSTLMLRMLADDLASELKPTVMLLDPHGNLVQDLLALIPKHRLVDVVLVDVADPENGVSINPLVGMADDRQHAAFMANEVLALVDALFEGKETSGPMLRAQLKNLILLGTSFKPQGESFMTIMHCLEDEDYADYILSKNTDRKIAESYKASKANRGSDNGYNAWKPYLMARLSPFVDSPAMKRLLNMPTNKFSLADGMASGKIMLFSLSKAILGDTESRIAGSMILAQTFGAAIARGRSPSVKHRPVHLYVDELGSFATDTLPAMLAEARKFGLRMTTANQSLDQLRNRNGEHTIARAILANAATKIMMRLGPSDADLLGTYFNQEFTADDMARLPDMHAVASMQSGGRPLPPFVFKTFRLAPDPLLHVERDTVRGASNLQYSEPISAMNEVLTKAYDLDSSTLGRNPLV